MSTYHAIVSCPGHLRTGTFHGLRYRIGDVPVEVVLRTLIQYVPGGWTWRGLRMNMTLDAQSLAQACGVIERCAEQALALVALAAAAPAPLFHVEQVWEDPPVGARGHLIRFLHCEVPKLKLRKAYVDHVERTFVGLATASERTSSRVSRALRWYRKALVEQDPVDRFTGLWIALESLNPLLESYYATVPDRVVCREYQRDVGPRIGVYGVEEHLHRIPEGGNGLSRDAKRLRNAVLHSFERTDRNRERATKLNGALEIGVPRAVARVLGLPADTEDSLARSVLTMEPPTYNLGMQAWFTRVAEGPLGIPGYYPWAEGAVEVSTEYSETGEPTQASATGSASLFAGEAVQFSSCRATLEYAGGIRLPVRVPKAFQVKTWEQLPDTRGKGVTLWECNEEKVHWAGEGAR